MTHLSFGIRVLGIGFGCLLYATAFASPRDSLKSLFDLMSYQEVLDVTIAENIDTIRAARRRDTVFETVLSFRDESGAWQSWPVNLRPRGSFRRTKCDVPPLFVDLKKSVLKERGLAPFDDFDLVTQCVADRELARELLIREHLAYRLYHELTPYSYRAQLVRLTFRDPLTGSEEKQWGIIIEDTSELEARTGTEKVEVLSVQPQALAEESFQQMALFQNMIGNADWHLPTGRNVKFFRKGDQLIPVPFDFDFSSLVRAPYARADTTQEGVLRFMKPGLYFGSATLEPMALQPALEVFADKRRSWLSIIRQQKLLPANVRKELRAFLKVFFEVGPVVFANGAS